MHVGLGTHENAACLPLLGQEAAKELVDMAVAGGSDDNVCALVVRLPSSPQVDS